MPLGLPFDASSYMFRPYYTPRWGVIALAICALGVCTGCGASDDSGSEATAGSNDNEPTITSLRFDAAPDDDAVRVSPGAVRELKVVASPAGRYPVSFSMLGEVHNAALDVSKTTTNESGEGFVSLTAPTETASFVMRATIGQATAEIAVSVSNEGYTTVRVLPSYQGRRTITSWFATASANRSCADLGQATPPADGPLRAEAAPDQVPQIGAVPIGERVAVTLRAGHYVGGCVDVPSVSGTAPNVITVPVADRPIQLLGATLDVRLAAQPNSVALRDALRAHMDVTIADAVLVDALLDSMTAVASTEQRSAFTQQREYGSWDQKLRTLPQFGSSYGLRPQLKTWMLAGTERVVGEPLLDGRVTSTDEQNPVTTLELAEVVGLDAAYAGFRAKSDASWKAEAGDTVLLGSTVTWSPSLLLMRLASAAADEAEVNGIERTALMSSLVDCPSVAQALKEAGVSDVPFPGCTVECARALCESAMAGLWGELESASVERSENSTLVLSATGAAAIDDQARLLGFEGSWVATLGSPITTVSMTGAARAAKPELVNE